MVDHPKKPFNFNANPENDRIRDKDNAKPKLQPKHLNIKPAPSPLPPLGGAVVYGEYAGFSWWLDRNEIASSIANANRAP